MSVMPVAIHTLRPTGWGSSALQTSSTRAKRSHRPQRNDDPTTVRDDNHHAALRRHGGNLGAVSATTIAGTKPICPLRIVPLWTNDRPI